MDGPKTNHHGEDSALELAVLDRHYTVKLFQRMLLDPKRKICRFFNLKLYRCLQRAGFGVSMCRLATAPQLFYPSVLTSCLIHLWALAERLTCLDVRSVMPLMRCPSFEVEDSLAEPGWESNDRRLGRAVRVFSTTSLILSAKNLPRQRVVHPHSINHLSIPAMSLRGTRICLSNAPKRQNTSSPRPLFWFSRVATAKLLPGARVMDEVTSALAGKNFIQTCGWLKRLTGPLSH